MGARGAAGPGEIILAGFRIFGNLWRDFLRIGAVTVVPVTLAGVMATTPFTPDVVGDIMTNQATSNEIEHRLGEVDVEQWIRLGVAYGIYLVVSWLATSVAFAACLVVVRDHVRGSAIGPGRALRESSRNLGRFLALAFVAGILSAIGFLLCLLPGFWLVTSWIVAPVVLFHEGRGPLRSLGASYRLVRSRFWPTALIVLLSFVAYTVLSGGANALVSVLMAPLGLSDGVLYFAATLVAGGVLAFVGLGIHAAISTELYLDLVARRDGPNGPGSPVPPPLEAFS